MRYFTFVLFLVAAMTIGCATTVTPTPATDVAQAEDSFHVVSVLLPALRTFYPQIANAEMTVVRKSFATIIFLKDYDASFSDPSGSVFGTVIVSSTGLTVMDKFTVSSTGDNVVLQLRQDEDDVVSCHTEFIRVEAGHEVVSGSGECTTPEATHYLEVAKLILGALPQLGFDAPPADFE